MCRERRAVQDTFFSMNQRTGRRQCACSSRTVVLDEKIEEVRSLFLQARIQVLAVEGLHHRASDPAGSDPFPFRTDRSPNLREAPDDGHRLIIVNALASSGFRRATETAGDRNHPVDRGRWHSP